ncbi:dephospho-CoA kinase [Oceanobacillus picturae]|uniref:Dephospho-CoA kinase n=1 Tax=Oceanobacillus picturae TaxID=171693 RepID=A0A0U9H8A4_9BACI|nr:dephospho-CoA kinase [Oceanobacillus picturae]GAQ18922.1 dephospho-CoA kinase [Oceanobacillus picturae]
MTLIIGLTGSIASGKSTVSLMFHDLNVPVIDADKISREVVNPHEDAYNKIVDTFGNSILQDDKTIDRAKLGEIIFNDHVMREKLNNIVHPAVRERMLAKRDALVKAGVPTVVLDIPLLFESNLTHLVDKTLVISVTESVQLTRLMTRNGYNEQEARQRIQSQIPITEKVKMADAVIDNNGTKQETYEQLEQLLQQWRDLTTEN